ncbi:MAG: hypothetical protein WAU54_21285 [Chania sp.]
MVESLRNPLIGLLCLSTVGCANLSGEEIATVGVVAVGIGALVAVALLSDGSDDERNKKGRHKGGEGKEHRKNHAERR